MKIPCSPFLAAVIAVAGLCSCQSTNPSSADMDRYYKEAQVRADRIVARLAEQRDEGKITPEEYNEKVQKVKAQVGQQAMEIAWTRHEIEESKMRALGIPTGDHPVYLSPPNVGSLDSFYRPSGQDGGGFSNGYQGMGSGMWHGYQPGSMIDTLGGGTGLGSNPLLR